jgi:hypothetical protein
MATLDEWTATVCAALGLRPDEIDRNRVLDLARDVAHSVARPAAPLTAYIAGLATGRGGDPATVATTVSDLVRQWATDNSSDADPT